MTLAGLTSRDTETIRSIFRAYPGISRVRIFGSRAKGNFRKGSDIDFAIEGDFPLFSVKNDFDESSLPYFVDIVDMSELREEPLREHIDRVGKVIYERI